MRTDGEAPHYSLRQWCEDHRITLHYIKPGEPTQNAYVERNNGTIRRELPDAYLFTSLKEVRAMANDWQQDYNQDRPHKALRYLSPEMYLRRWWDRHQTENDSKAGLSTPPSGNSLKHWSDGGSG